MIKLIFFLEVHISLRKKNLLKTIQDTNHFVLIIKTKTKKAKKMATIQAL